MDSNAGHTTSVDRVHEVVRLHRCRLGVGERYRRGIVDADVDAAEGFDGGADGGGDLLLVADVAQHRKAASAGLLDLGGRRVDRAGKTVAGSMSEEPETIDILFASFTACVAYRGCGTAVFAARTTLAPEE